MLNVLDVARYIINYSNEKGYGVSNLRLQKLLYFVQAYYLAFTDSHEPCFSDVIEAWEFGPVVPQVYHEFKCYGSGNIPTINSYFDYDENAIWSIKRIPYVSNVIPENDKKIIQGVVEQFSNYSTSALVELTHKQKPWRSVYDRSQKNEIKKSSIKEYFEN